MEPEGSLRDVSFSVQDGYPFRSAPQVSCYLQETFGCNRKPPATCETFSVSTATLLQTAGSRRLQPKQCCTLQDSVGRNRNLPARCRASSVATENSL